MTESEKLIALLRDVQYLGGLEEKIADHLIANGVVVREKGKWTEDGYYGNPFVCSYCGHEGCYSGNYGNKDYYPTNFCPNCGADMRKGENG